MDKPHKVESPGQRTVKSSRSWASWLLVVLVLYVLSMGPVGWVWRHGYLHISAATLQTIYFPLLWLVKNCQPVSNILNWYFSLWS